MAAWFCDVGGTMLGVADDAVRVDLVAVVEDAPGRLGDAEPVAGARRHLDGRGGAGGS